MTIDTSNGSGAVVKTIDGRKLQRARGRYSPTLRAVLADQLTSQVAVKNLSRRQAAAVTNTTIADIRAVRRARTSAPGDYAALRAGRLDVETVRQRQLAGRPISDERLRRIIERAGAERTFDAICALIEPANGMANGHHAANNDAAVAAPISNKRDAPRPGRWPK
jgi:hypothetical protein